jgi:hypothetical protein
MSASATVDTIQKWIYYGVTIINKNALYIKNFFSKSGGNIMDFIVELILELFGEVFFLWFKNFCCVFCGGCLPHPLK